MIRRISTVAILLALGAGATPASAQTLGIKGSDTLEPVVTDVLALKCTTAMISAVLSYSGGGSGGGENAMGAGTQLIAPMSSAMSSSGANCAISGASSAAQGMVIGLDGIAMVLDSKSSQACGSGHAARTDPGSAAPLPPFSRFAASGTFTGTSGYVIGGTPSGGTATTWKDILRVLYTGYDTTMPTPPGTAGPGNCNSQIRRDLADHYENLFQAGCTSNPNCASGIKHAYRRNDLSGTTDTFLGLIGAPKLAKDAAGKVVGTPFCNGLENEDNDPIRRPCDPSEQVCEYDGTLGLVLPISVPTGTNDTTVLYNSGALPNFGRFLTAPAPTCDFGPAWIVPGVIPTPASMAALNSSRCDCRFPHPNDFITAGVDASGNPTASPVKNNRFAFNTRLANRCQVPTTTTSTATARWNLLNGDDGGRDNSPPGWGTRYDDGTGTGFTKCCSVIIGGVSTQVTEDPRAQNFAYRSPTNGAFQTDSAGNQIQVSFHRIHASTNGKTNVAVAAGTDLCQKVDATENIGCLVEFPAGDKCSVGFAGLDASDKIYAERVAINAVDPTQTTIQNLITAPGPTAYPLARKLYLNSLFGFGAMAEGAATHTGSLTTFALDAGATTTQKRIDAQYNLSKCFYSDYANATPSLTKVGFIPLPANGGKPLCEDGCGGTNACIAGDSTVMGSFDNIFSR